MHLGNVLLRPSPGLQDLSDQEIHDRYCHVEPEPITRRDGGKLPQGVPSHAVHAIWLGKDSESLGLQEAKVWLIDLGEAFAPTLETKHEMRTPLMVRPPEFMFSPKAEVSFSSDVWTLACSIWRILSQRPLFEEMYFPEENLIMSMQIDILGRNGLPDSWWDNWERRSKYFTDAGDPVAKRYVPSWEKCFEQGIQTARKEEGLGQISPEEKEAIFAMLRPMLRWKPEDRCTAGKSWNRNG